MTENRREKRRRDGSKTERCVFRMSREDMAKLEEASKKLGKSKSDVLREGIDRVFRSSQYMS